MKDIYYQIKIQKLNQFYISLELVKVWGWQVAELGWQ